MSVIDLVSVYDWGKERHFELIYEEREKEEGEREMK